MTNNIFTRNSAADDGGEGIYVTSDGETGAGGVTIEKNTFNANIAGSHGGGVYANTHTVTGTAGAVRITGNKASGNKASYRGGILAKSFALSGTAGSISVVNSVVTGNIAINSYGGVKCDSATNPGGTTSAVTLTNNNTTQNRITPTMSSPSLTNNESFRPMTNRWKALSILSSACTIWSGVGI